jgi:hypothetical protein
MNTVILVVSSTLHMTAAFHRNPGRDDDFEVFDDDRSGEWYCLESSKSCNELYSNPNMPNGCCGATCCYGINYCCTSSGGCTQCGNKATGAKTYGIVFGLLIAVCCLVFMVRARNRYLRWVHPASDLPLPSLPTRLFILSPAFASAPASRGPSSLDSAYSRACTASSDPQYQQERQQRRQQYQDRQERRQQREHRDHQEQVHLRQQMRQELEQQLERRLSRQNVGGITSISSINVSERRYSAAERQDQEPVLAVAFYSNGNNSYANAPSATASPNRSNRHSSVPVAVAVLVNDS